MKREYKTVPECPCGSGRSYTDCCEALHTGNAVAKTAEQLMRSRYTAYTLGNEDYLLASWHVSKRPASLNLTDDPIKWIGLKLVQTQAGQPGDSQGTVHFVARYKLNGRAHRLEENSRFVYENGTWFYLDAEGK